MFKLFLLLNPIYVTFFWALVLNINTSGSKKPKAFLGKFMFIACLLYVSHLFYYLPIPEFYHYADSFYVLFNLSVWPLYFIYIRLLTIDEHFSLEKHFRYLLIPLIIFIMYGTGVLMMSEKEHLYFIFEMLKSDTSVVGIFLYQKTLYISSKVIFVSQAIIYMFLSYKLIKRNKDSIQNYYTNTEDDSLDKIQLLNLTLTITITISLITAAFGKEILLANEKWLIIPSILYSSVLFFIGWMGNIQRPVYIEIKEEELKNDYTNDALNSTMGQRKQIRKKIELLFEKEKIYLNKDLNIWDLAKNAGTNRTYISGVINNEWNQNFSAFVNAYRVKHAQNLMLKNPIISNQELADSSGFGSVVSLQRAFQSIEGKTLKQIRNKITT